MERQRTIRELRKTRGMTQKELADRLDLSNMSVSHRERAVHVPSARQLLALAKVLGVPATSIAFTGAEAAAERTSRKPSGE